MGLTVYGNLIIGIQVERENFFLEGDAEEWECDNHHKRLDSKDKFCAQDGTKFKKHIIETATPSFKAWAKENNMDVNEFYDCLFEEGDREEIGLYCIEAISDATEQDNIALGIKMISISNNGDPDCINVVYMEELLNYISKIENRAHKLGIKDKAMLFLNLYCSY